MNNPLFAVLIINYESNNTYGQRAFHEAAATIALAVGFIKLGHSVWLVPLPSATPILLKLYAQEAARSEGRIQFALVPCGTQVLGELTAETVQELACAGLTHWDTSIQVRPPRL